MKPGDINLISSNKMVNSLPELEFVPRQTGFHQLELKLIFTKEYEDMSKIFSAVFDKARKSEGMSTFPQQRPGWPLKGVPARNTGLSN